MTGATRVERLDREDARVALATPTASDDKYSRGVVGFVTGSAQYPGAAVLGVSAAAFMGVGMIRFRGDDEVAQLVLQRRPEVVCVPGRVDAWVLGSGVDASSRTWHLTTLMREALASGAPCVLDAGALDLVDEVSGWALVTPHARELSGMFQRVGREVTVDDIRQHPEAWVSEAATTWNVAVLLKGHRTLLATPDGKTLLEPPNGSEWLSTAGTGDVLAGAIGAALAAERARSSVAVEQGIRAIGESVGNDTATSESLLRVAAAAATLHALASHNIPAPFTALELAEGLRAVR